MFTSLFPIIMTRDLAAALAFYRELLGASVSYEFPGPDGQPEREGAHRVGPNQLGPVSDP